jgi:hypothetical protein
MKRASLGLALLCAGSLVLAAAGDKTSSVTGTVTRLQATDHTVFVSTGNGQETRFIWTAETRFNGTLSQGAKVTIRYTTQQDGQNLAHQISVGK